MEFQSTFSGSPPPLTNRGLPPPGAAPVISAFSPPSPRRHIFYPLKAALVNRAQLCGENFGALGAVLWRLWMCNYTSRRRYFLKPKLCETLLAPQRWIWQILRWQPACKYLESRQINVGKAKHSFVWCRWITLHPASSQEARGESLHSVAHLSLPLGLETKLMTKFLSA